MTTENELFSRIDPYWNYWVKDFPLMIDKKMAIDKNKYIALYENRAILAKNQQFGKITINFSLLSDEIYQFSIFNRMGQDIPNRQYLGNFKEKYQRYCHNRKLDSISKIN